MQFWGGLKKIFIPPKNVSVCLGEGGLKTFLYPQNCKTESGKFHEILTSVCVGVSKNFLYPPQIVSVWGVLKTETGKFLLHFQNSKSSNRCRSVYGTDIINKVKLFLVFLELFITLLLNIIKI